MGYESWAGIPFVGVDIDFITGSPLIAYKYRTMNLNRSFANICDNQGNLLFYTNGDYIDDSTDAPMQNGLNINPSTFADSLGLPVPQACLILQQPDSINKYYLFHNGLDNPPNYNLSTKLYCSVIDMNLNGGKGSVIQKNVVLINDILNIGHITACKHGNGRDWWIVFMKYNSNIIYKLLLTPGGVYGPYMQAVGMNRQNDAGQVIFSPDGSKFVYFNANYFTTGVLEIFDFDRCTGDFNNSLYIQIPMSNGFGGGVAFSSNNKFLYTANVDSVYQYDVTSTNISASKIVVAAYDNFADSIPMFNPFGTYFDKMQLAADGKIYTTTGNGTRYLHVINFPDSGGLLCDLVQHGVFLPTINFNSIPNHPNYFLGRDTGSVCDTITVWMGLTGAQPPKGALKALLNPNDGLFTLWFTVHDKPGWVEVYDVNGNLVFMEGVAQWSQYKQVDITQKSDGIYFVKMMWGAEEMNCKVIKEE